MEPNNQQPQMQTDWEGFFQMFAITFSATCLAMIVAMLIVHRTV